MYDLQHITNKCIIRPFILLRLWLQKQRKKHFIKHGKPDSHISYIELKIKYIILKYWVNFSTEYHILYSDKLLPSLTDIFAHLWIINISRTSSSSHSLCSPWRFLDFEDNTVHIMLVAILKFINYKIAVFLFYTSNCKFHSQNINGYYKFLISPQSSLNI